LRYRVVEARVLCDTYETNEVSRYGEINQAYQEQERSYINGFVGMVGELVSQDSVSECPITLRFEDGRTCRFHPDELEPS
jgi:hypothetical protein